jgi:hypothetical protein
MSLSRLVTRTATVLAMAAAAAACGSSGGSGTAAPGAPTGPAADPTSAGSTAAAAGSGGATGSAESTGSGGSTQGGGDRPAPCSLATTAQVTALTQLAMQDGRAQEGVAGQTRDCSFQSVKANAGGVHKAVRIGVVQRPQSAAEFVTGIEGAGLGGVKLSGVGDAAYYLPQSGWVELNAAGVTVIISDEILLVDSPPPAPTAALLTFAKQVASHL